MPEDVALETILDGAPTTFTSAHRMQSFYLSAHQPAGVGMEVSFRNLTGNELFVSDAFILSSVIYWGFLLDGVDAELHYVARAPAGDTIEFRAVRPTFFPIEATGVASTLPADNGASFNPGPGQYRLTVNAGPSGEYYLYHLASGTLLRQQSMTPAVPSARPRRFSSASTPANQDRTCCGCRRVQSTA